MSETTGKRDVVQRHQIADYLNIGTSESPNWVLMGVGFTSLNETFGAESESSKYVNEASESSSVTSYKSAFPFEAHLIKSQEAVNALYTVGRNHLVGAEAEFEYCRVELFEGKASAESTYAARKFLLFFHSTMWTCRKCRICTGGSSGQCSIHFGRTQRFQKSWGIGA